MLGALDAGHQLGLGCDPAAALVEHTRKQAARPPFIRFSDRRRDHRRHTAQLSMAERYRARTVKARLHWILLPPRPISAVLMGACLTPQPAVLGQASREPGEEVGQILIADVLRSKGHDVVKVRPSDSVEL